MSTYTPLDQLEIVDEDAARRLRATVPSIGALAARTALNLVFEVLTDMGKNAFFSGSFGVLPASVRPVLLWCDVVQIGSSVGVVAGVVLAGIALSQ